MSVGGGSSAVDTTYTKDNETTQVKPGNLNGYTTTKSVTLNGIKWKAMITDGSGNGVTGNTGEILDTATTQVTITGTLPDGTTGGFKYKYTNRGSGNQSPDLSNNNNNSQQLPSSVKTIKIVLKKKA